MRHLALLPLLYLSLAACGKEESQQDIQQVDQALASDDLIDNDLTAIDAISGADGNMAADVDPSKWDRDGGAITDGAGRNTTATSARAERPVVREKDDGAPADSTEAPAPAASAANSAEPND